MISADPFADVEPDRGRVHQLNPRGDDPHRAWQLPVIDPSRWIGREPPQRRFIVDEWLARGSAAILAGEDGVGKSLLAQQLATCIAAGLPFLGLPVTKAAAMYVTCEDDEDELWRRQRHINARIGLDRDCFPVVLVSLRGFTDTALGGFDEHGRFHTSPLLDAIEQRALEFAVGFVGLDNVAHMFSGNENARRDVAGFCSVLDRLAMRTDAGVMALAHPAKATGSEYSGSTGWSAHVRQRWFLDRGEEHDSAARVLHKSKANYSTSGDEVRFRWHAWAFVRDAELGDDQRAELATTAQANAENDAFLRCLAERTRQRRAVTDTSGRNFAPAIFATMPEAKGLPKDRLSRAMDRLFRIGRIETAFLWRNTEKGRDVIGLREVVGGASDQSPNVTPNRPPITLPDRPQATAPIDPGHTPIHYVYDGRGLEGPPPASDPHPTAATGGVDA